MLTGDLLPAAPSPRSTRQGGFPRALFTLLVSLVVVGHLGSATAVRAEVSAADSVEDPAYRRLIKEGLAEYEARHFDEARSLFRRAHELNPNARTYRGIGMASFELRDYVSAVHNLSAALRDSRKPLSSEQRKHSQDLLDRSRMFVDVYTLKLTPEDARVLIDGRLPEYEADGSLILGFGQHALEASATGYAIRALPITVRGGEKKELSVTLEKLRTGLPRMGEGTSAGIKNTASEPSFFDKPGVAWFLAGGASFLLAAGAGYVLYHNQSSLNSCKNPATDMVCINNRELVSYRNLALGTTIGATAATGTFIVLGILQARKAGDDPAKVACAPTLFGLTGLTCGRLF
jgi:tetratricopeptide (TPR) repeat protein